MRALLALRGLDAADAGCRSAFSCTNCTRREDPLGDLDEAGIISPLKMHPDGDSADGSTGDLTDDLEEVAGDIWPLVPPEEWLNGDILVDGSAGHLIGGQEDAGDENALAFCWAGRHYHYDCGQHRGNGHQSHCHHRSCYHPYGPSTLLRSVSSRVLATRVTRWFGIQ